MSGYIFANQTTKLKNPTSRGPESPCCVVTVQWCEVQLVTGGGRAAALLGEDTDTQLNFYYIITKISTRYLQ